MFYDFYNEESLRYSLCLILGKPCLFTNLRILRESIPNDILFCYSIRHDDEGLGEPCSLEYKVLINHYGDLLTRNPFDFGSSKYLDLEEEDLIFLDCNTTLEEFMNIEIKELEDRCNQREGSKAAVWKYDYELGIAYFCADCKRFVCSSGKCKCGCNIDLALPKQQYKGKVRWD